MAHPFFEKIGKKFKEFFEKMQYWFEDFFSDIKTNRKKQAILAVALLAVFVLAYLTVTLLAHTVKIHVKDANGNPLDGALVRLYDENGNEIGVRRTVNGTATFDNLPRKAYKYTVCLDGYDCVDGRYYPDDPDGAVVRLQPYSYGDNTQTGQGPAPTPPADQFGDYTPPDSDDSSGNVLPGGSDDTGTGGTPDYQYVPDATLNITVRESSTTRFIFGATVSLKDAQTHTHLAQGATNNQGRISMGVKQGTSVLVQVFADGYAASQPQSVAITQSEQSLDVFLNSTSSGQAAQTTVTVSETDGTPVDSARIQVYTSGQSPLVDQLTANSGHASFALPKTGSFNLLASKTGFDDALRSIQAGDNLQITLTRLGASSRPASLTVNVKNNNGQLSPAARIGVSKKIGNDFLPYASQTANGQGIGQFNDLQAGWVLRVSATSAAGISSASKDVTLISGSNTLEITLPRPYDYPNGTGTTCQDGQICPANYACPANPTPAANTRNYCVGPKPVEPPSVVNCPDGTVCPLDAECIPNSITGLHYNYGEYTCLIIPPANKTQPILCPDGTICPVNKACSPTDATRNHYTCEAVVVPPGTGGNNGTGYIYPPGGHDPLPCPDGIVCPADYSCNPNSITGRHYDYGQYTCGGPLPDPSPNPSPLHCPDGTTCPIHNACVPKPGNPSQYACTPVDGYPYYPTPTPTPVPCPNGGFCTPPNQCLRTSAGQNTCGTPDPSPSPSPVTCQDGTTCFPPNQCVITTTGQNTCGRIYLPPGGSPTPGPFPCPNGNICIAPQQCIRTSAGQNTCGDPAPNPTPIPTTCQDGTSCLPPSQCVITTTGQNTCGYIYPPGETPTPTPTPTPSVSPYDYTQTVTNTPHAVCLNSANGATSFSANNYTYALVDINGDQTAAFEVRQNNAVICTRFVPDCIYRLGTTSFSNRLLEQQTGVAINLQTIDPRTQCVTLNAATTCTGTSCTVTPAACANEPYAPVCGGNGVTYSNQCLANQAHVPYSFGTCTTGQCADVYAPVCGLNGITYANACEANRNGQTGYAGGACQPPIAGIAIAVPAGVSLIAPPDAGELLATNCTVSNRYVFNGYDAQTRLTTPVLPTGGATATMTYTNAYFVTSQNACTIYWNDQTARTPYQKILHVGWNAVGAPRQAIRFNEITGNCRYLSISEYWGAQSRLETGRRLPLDTLMQPGHGYWVNYDGPAGSTCTLGTSSNTQPPTPTPSGSGSTTPTPTVTAAPPIPLPEPDASTRILVDYASCRDTPSNAPDEVLTGITYGGKSRFCRLKASDNSIVQIQKSGINCQDPYAGYHVDPSKPNYLWNESGSVEVYGCGREFSGGIFEFRENEEFIGTKKSGFPACCGLTAITASGRQIPIRPEGLTWFPWEQPLGSDPMDANALTAECKDNTVSVGIAPRGLTNIGHVALCSSPKLATLNTGPTPAALWKSWPHEVLSIDTPNDSCAQNQNEVLCGVKQNGNLLCCTLTSNFAPVPTSARAISASQCNEKELATGLPGGKLGCTTINKDGYGTVFKTVVDVAKPFTCPQNMAVCNYDATTGTGKCCTNG